MTARAVMVLGTTSGAGKSWLATALCRWYARQGSKVAPFKAQNMSNNARVVPGPGGAMGEIGSAQYFQALAARAEPEVRMNPVLLKPERDTHSQVVVMGQVHSELTEMPWRERSELLWPFARGALHGLMAENDVVVIEGAGSPAEINLHASDYVNMRTAREVRAACLLVTDIDRGGAFAHLYGTHALLPAEERALIRGFVLNRFRGDARLLAPGPEQLQQLCGVPTVAVLPMWRGHGLPEEDGVFDEGTGGQSHTPGAVQIAIVAFPHISNLDEFQPLRQCPSARLRWVRTPAEVAGTDWVVLPGSKHTTGDLAWLRSTGLADAVLRHAQAGGRVLGVCGGLQMLGATLIDEHGIEGRPHTHVEGLGLLPLVTRFERSKLLRRTQARFAALAAPWTALSNVMLGGYEIRQGRTEAIVGVGGASGMTAALYNDEGHAIGWQRGNVLGAYAHGLFESEAVMCALFGSALRPLDTVFDGLADFIDLHFQPGVLDALIQ